MYTILSVQKIRTNAGVSFTLPIRSHREREFDILRNLMKDHILTKEDAMKSKKLLIIGVAGLVALAGCDKSEDTEAAKTEAVQQAPAEVKSVTEAVPAPAAPSEIISEAVETVKQVNDAAATAAQGAVDQAVEVQSQVVEGAKDSAAAVTESAAQAVDASKDAASGSLDAASKALDDLKPAPVEESKPAQ
ncbi:MAG: hypothetical protein KGZ88_16975 [Methylomicrobium sp.]|nr:hypothetical protein [Methylomicrobium sp.]